jgi:hypothetical protein
MSAYLCKKMWHVFVGRFEFYNSNFDDMKEVLSRICKEANVEVLPGSVVRRPSFELGGSRLTRVIITALLIEEEPRRGYFMPLAGHPEAEMLHEKLGLPKPLQRVA